MAPRIPKLCPVIVLCVTSCTFTVPTAPTLSAYGTWRPSPAADLMMLTAPNKAAKVLLYDEARRCEHELSELIGKMKAERAGRGTLTVLGGLTTLSGSFAAALKKDDSDDGGTIAAATIAAIGGLVALSAPLVGEPASEMERYTIAVSHYEAARNHAANAVKGTGCGADGHCYLEIRSELSKCSDPAPAAK